MERLEWLDEKKDEIIELYNVGKKQTEIAHHFNVSQTAISSRLRKWGLSNSDGNRFKRIDEIKKEEVERMYWEDEMHPSQIAKIYGCSKQVITNRMNRWGIQSRTKSQARIGKLNPIYNVGHTEAAREKMSEAFDNGRKMGFNTCWGKGSHYASPNQGMVWMRSGWETKTADYLTSKNIDWFYEYEWLIIDSKLRYLPDFYLPKFNLYIEVKGRKKEKDMEKFMRAKNIYNILFWDAEELLKRKIIVNPGITELYGKYKDCESFQDDWDSYINNY